MKVKLDENMPGEAAVFLREQGCDVETVLSESLGGSPDPSVVAAARYEGRILITLDKGIADVTNPLYSGHAGLVLIRAKHPGMTGDYAIAQSALRHDSNAAHEGSYCRAFQRRRSPAVTAEA